MGDIVRLCNPDSAEDNLDSRVWIYQGRNGNLYDLNSGITTISTRAETVDVPHLTLHTFNYIHASNVQTRILLGQVLRGTYRPPPAPAVKIESRKTY